MVDGSRTHEPIAKIFLALYVRHTYEFMRQFIYIRHLSLMTYKSPQQYDCKRTLLKENLREKILFLQRKEIKFKTNYFLTFFWERSLSNEDHYYFVQLKQQRHRLRLRQRPAFKLELILSSCQRALISTNASNLNGQKNVWGAERLPLTEKISTFNQKIFHILVFWGIFDPPSEQCGPLIRFKRFVSLSHI